jgi:hypothetical protein
MSDFDQDLTPEEEGVPLHEFLMQITNQNIETARQLAEASARMERLTKGFTVLGGVMLAALLCFVLGSGMSLAAQLIQLGIIR